VHACGERRSRLPSRPVRPAALDPAIRQLSVRSRQGIGHGEGYHVSEWLFKGAILALMWLKCAPVKLQPATID
jgi:hypothetical protein